MNYGWKSLVVVVTVIVALAPVTAAPTATAGADAPQGASVDTDVQGQATTGVSVDGPESVGDESLSTRQATNGSSDGGTTSAEPCEQHRETAGEDNRTTEETRRQQERCKAAEKNDTDDGTDDTQDGGIQTTGLTTENVSQDLRSIGLNETATGTIDTSDPYNTSFRGYYEPVTFSGEQGQVININMRSGDDTYLYLLDPSGEVVARDDDGGDGLDSEILQRLQSTGNYTIIATSYDSQDTFEYELSVEEASDRDLRSISVGGAVYSTIEDDDPYNDSIRGNYEPVTFHGEAGEEISIRMWSDNSENHLMLVGPDGSLITESEDYEAAGIEATLPTTGNYTVLAGSDDGGFIQYQLSVLSDSHRDAGTVDIGETVDGTVDTGDAYNATFYGYHESVTFDGQAGQEVAIDVQARNLYDTSLYLLAPNGSVVAGSLSVEDGSLLADLPDSGTYTVVVGSDRYGDQTFDYRLGVRLADHGDARSIGFDESVTSTVDTSDPINSAYEGHYEPVAFYGQAGEEVSISLGTDGGYGRVHLVAPNGTVIARSDDHSAQDVKAVLPTTGNYTVIVGSESYNPETFEYQLSLTTSSHDDLQSIAMNSTRESTLDTADRQNTSYEGRYHEAVEFAGTAGQNVTVSMRAEDIDTYLHLVAPNGTVIAENDYGGNEGSLVTVTLPATGNYTVITTSDDYETQTFDYELSLTVPQDDLRAVPADSTKQGALDASDPQNSTYRGYYEPVTYEGTTGEEVRISMTSEDDTYLYLVAPNGSVIARDDDGGSGLNSEISTVLPVNGSYTIIATSYDDTDTFPYRLSVETDPTSADLRSINVGQTLEGEVGADDPADSGFEGHHEPVTVDGQAGEEVTITVRPDGDRYTDTYLYLVGPNGTVVSEADDGVRDGSRIHATFPATGTYTVIVTNDYGDDSYEYSLSVQAANHSDARSVRVGETVTSTVDTDDPYAAGYEGHYEPLTFHGEAGQELTISRQFQQNRYYDDIRMLLLRPNGSVVAESRYSYDGEMKVVLPTTGNYTLVTTSQYVDNGTGEYAFTIVNDTHQNAQSVGLNQGIGSTLDSGDPFNSTYGGDYESVAYDGEAGQQVRISLLPTGVAYADTYLYLVAPNGTVIDQNDYAAEGSQIEATLPVNGTYEIIVAKDWGAGHYDYQLTVSSLGTTPTSGTADLSLTKYELSTTNLTVGETLNVSANVVNDGGVSGSMTVTAYVNGSAVSERTVTVPAGESVTVPFSLTFETAGTRTVSVGDLNATTVTVEPASDGQNISRKWSADIGNEQATLTLADVDGDGAAEIAYSPHESHGPSTYGVVEDGNWVWSKSSSAAVKTRSAGDVNGDGTPEAIFHTKVDSTWVRPYDENGSYLWSGTHSNWAGGSATVDSDEDGRAEVLAHSAGEGGDLTVWDDDGTVLWDVANESHLDGLIATADVVGDDTPELLTTLPPNGNRKGLNLATKDSDGSVRIVRQYGPDRFARATFTHLDDDGELEILAVYPRGGFVTAYDINGSVQWNRSIAPGEDGRLLNITGDATPDPAVWNGTGLSVMNGATGETGHVTASGTILDAAGRGDSSVAALTNTSVDVIASGQVVDSVSTNGTSANAFGTGDTDGDGAEEVVVGNTTSLTVYDVTGTATPDEPATFDLRSVTAPDSASTGNDVVVAAEVVNTGNETATQSVGFSHETPSGVETLTRNVTLAPGESTRVAFTFGSGISEASIYSASIETANDTVTTSVEFTGQQFVCGVSTGDPHFVTYDGIAYDFQGVGEFVLANATAENGSLVVQVRHTPVAGSTSVSITNATATVVDGHQVQINAERSTPLSIDGTAVSLADGENVSVGNGTVKRNGNTYTVVYPGDDGMTDATDERLQVDVIGNRLDLRLCLHPNRSGEVGGLLGSPNGNASDDLALANGTVVGPDIDTDTLYGSYRDSWRVTNNTTVFTYDDGKGPDAYYFPNYPERIVTLSDLNDTVRERAEELAIEAGLEPGTAAFRDAVIDYALTGDSSYFASATTAATNNVTTDATEADPMATAVELRPTSVSTANGTTVTYDVVVTDAFGGVGAYNATVSVANGTVGSVTNVSLNGDPGLQNVSRSTDGTVVAFEGALADTSETGEVTIATVTVKATATGQTDIGLAVAAVGNESGTSYNVTRTTGSSLNVTGIEKLKDSYAGPPRDVDGDGVYEDINGDGDFDVVDVQALYTVRNTETVQNNAARFDVNGDGTVDIVDVQALYVESQ